MQSTVRYALALVAILACQQPKQPLQPSYFTQKKPEGAPATCRETIDCYAACRPLVEECLLRCDQESTPQAVERARAVSLCSAQNNCAADRACEQQSCALQLQACP